MSCDKKYLITCNLNIDTVSCPGAILPPLDVTYVQIKLFRQVQHTGCVPAVFPLCFNQSFCFKTSVESPCVSDVAECLQGMQVSIKLFQVVPSFNAIPLARYKTTASEFLFFDPSVSAARTVKPSQLYMKTYRCFPGIQPLLEISTVTTIEEEGTEDDQDEEAEPFWPLLKSSSYCQQNNPTQFKESKTIKEDKLTPCKHAKKKRSGANPPSKQCIATTSQKPHQTCSFLEILLNKSKPSKSFLTCPSSTTRRRPRQKSKQRSRQRRASSNFVHRGCMNIGEDQPSSGEPCLSQPQRGVKKICRSSSSLGSSLPPLPSISSGSCEPIPHPSRGPPPKCRRRLSFSCDPYPKVKPRRKKFCFPPPPVTAPRCYCGTAKADASCCGRSGAVMGVSGLCCRERKKIDCECQCMICRPEFVVRKAESKLLKRLPGLCYPTCPFEMRSKRAKYRLLASRRTQSLSGGRHRRRRTPCPPPRHRRLNSASPPSLCSGCPNDEPASPSCNLCPTPRPRRRSRPSASPSSSPCPSLCSDICSAALPPLLRRNVYVSRGVLNKTAGQDQECPICEAFQKYLGRPYEGHRDGNHNIKNAPSLCKTKPNRKTCCSSQLPPSHGSTSRGHQTACQSSQREGKMQSKSRSPCQHGQTRSPPKCHSRCKRKFPHRDRSALKHRTSKASCSRQSKSRETSMCRGRKRSRGRSNPRSPCCGRSSSGERSRSFGQSREDQCHCEIENSISRGQSARAFRSTCQDQNQDQDQDQGEHQGQGWIRGTHKSLRDSSLMVLGPMVRDGPLPAAEPSSRNLSLEMEYSKIQPTVPRQTVENLQSYRPNADTTGCNKKESNVAAAELNYWEKRLEDVKSGKIIPGTTPANSRFLHLLENYYADMHLQAIKKLAP